MRQVGYLQELYRDARSTEHKTFSHHVSIGRMNHVQVDTKKREPLKNPTKIEEIQEKTFIDRN